MLEKYIEYNGEGKATGLFSVIGSFGKTDPLAAYESEEKDGGVLFSYSDGTIRLTAAFTLFPNGAILREDRFENLTDGELSLRKISACFKCVGNDYEVYTQYNGWQQESRGAWQKLVSEVSAASCGIRTCDGAAPMLALKDGYTGKCTAFHLFPNCQWRMKARKTPVNGCYESVRVEAGILDEGLDFKVLPKETIELPSVLFFEADSAIDFDAYKLHEVYSERYPRKAMPVLYNSWLYDFGNIDADEILKQVDCAAEMGVEAFMLDAGWFGDGEDWWEQAGDWTESLSRGPKGRLAEISERVRRRGMKFGLWFEPERAGLNSRLKKEHPDYVFDGIFFDFSKREAREYMARKILNVIETYSLEWIKFDFNPTVSFDKTGSSFYRYMQGQREFVRLIREKHPDLYITNCAGGGYRMDLCQGEFTDSFWLSDNQGPYDGIRIVKDTLKRMPSQLIERWNVQTWCDGFTLYGSKEKQGLMLSCNNATGDRVMNLGDAFCEAFLTGGPIGFSCDIAAFPDRYKAFWKRAISRFKADRSFYGSAAARILIDAEDVIAIEFSDRAFCRCVIRVFTKNIRAYDLTVYPVVDKTADYDRDGKTVSGGTIAAGGIVLSGLYREDCQTVELKKKE